MADTIRRVDYYYVDLPDQPGEGVRLLTKLKESGVNLLSLTAFPRGSGTSQVVLVPEKPEALLKAAKTGGLTLSPRKVAFFIHGKDRMGAVADILSRLAQAKVNVTATNAACGGGGAYGMILWVKPQDVEPAARALGV